MKTAAVLREKLKEGLVIPAHPLALDSKRHLDVRHQRALTRYYLASGAGGVAVGVHTTQFAIHQPEVGLLVPVLELVHEECVGWVDGGGDPPVTVAGVIGKTDQAINEAALARSLGYDCALLGLGAMQEATTDELIDHARAVAEVIPVFGFYLQPAVGGRVLGYRFWRRFAEIEDVIAIKIAPFNRYYTGDVLRAVIESGREEEIALYTGNDDNIVGDLLTPFSYDRNGEKIVARIVGGLLGQWAVWTSRSVELLARIHGTIEAGPQIPQQMLTLNVEVTDANAAIFDSANGFQGCIPGIHEVLRRQGLLRGSWCLEPEETLSPGQREEIDRVYRAYPHLNDDVFVQEHLDEWLSG
jgi:dihydrodipicolinate synthase/N-acetylneuraminate lyase